MAQVCHVDGVLASELSRLHATLSSDIAATLRVGAAAGCHSPHVWPGNRIWQIRISGVSSGASSGVDPGPRIWQATFTAKPPEAGSEQAVAEAVRYRSGTRAQAPLHYTRGRVKMSEQEDRRCRWTDQPRTGSPASPASPQAPVRRLLTR